MNHSAHDWWILGKKNEKKIINAYVEIVELLP